MNPGDNPLWNPAAKSASIRKWAEHLYHQSRKVFLADKTHTHILFLFKDEGPIGINPIPPKTEQEQIYGSIRRAVKDHNLYGIIHIGECWTYFPKGKKDHTAFQLLDGEMRVRDLSDQDKTEALQVRMESRDGDCVIYLDQIVRNGEDIVLGERRKIEGEEKKWFCS